MVAPVTSEGVSARPAAAAISRSISVARSSWERAPASLTTGTTSPAGGVDRQPEVDLGGVAEDGTPSKVALQSGKSARSGEEGGG